MKILITGASGYLGSSLCDYFKAKQTCIVKILCRKSQCNCENWHLGQFADFDVVFHAAWPNVTGEYRQNRDLQEQGYSFTIQLVENLDLKKLKKFFFFGSQAEIDNANSISDENTKRTPKSEYGKIKSQTHLYLQSLFSSHQYVHLIIYSLYGGNQGVNWFIPMLLKKTKLDESFRLNNPRLIMSFLHIDNFCEIIYKLLCVDAFGEFIISSPEHIQLSDIHEYIYSQVYCEQKVLYTDSSNPRYVAGNSQKLFKEIGPFQDRKLYTFLERYVYEGI